MSNESTVAERPAAERPNFLQFLARHGGGGTVDDLTDALRDMVAHLEGLEIEHGVAASKGVLSLKITLKRAKGRYEVTVDRSVKVPQAPSSSDIMWATPQNALVVENPNQQRFAFTEVVTPRGAARA